MELQKTPRALKRTAIALAGLALAIPLPRGVAPEAPDAHEGAVVRDLQPRVPRVLIRGLRQFAEKNPCAVVALLQFLQSADAAQGVTYLDALPSYEALTALLDHAEREGAVHGPLLNPYSGNAYVIEIVWRSEEVRADALLLTIQARLLMRSGGPSHLVEPPLLVTIGEKGLSVVPLSAGGAVRIRHDEEPTGSGEPDAVEI